MYNQIDEIMKSLQFAWRQRHAFFTAFEMLKNLLTFKVPFTKIFATIIAIFQCFGCVISDTPMSPMGEELDLTGYSLVFSDEFDGDSLDYSKWSIRNTGAYNKGFYCDDNLEVKDGNLIISGKYMNGDYGDGWYASSIIADTTFCGGYFEMRAILSKNLMNTRDFWSSFWITCDNVYNPEVSKGGPGGCEIDIMESHSGSYKLERHAQCVTHAVWCNGYDSDPDTIDGRNMGSYYVPDPFTTYNTYGLKWTDTEYIWYINGVETVRSSYPAGVSRVEEELVLSLSIPLYDFIREIGDDANFIIDYVRVYQTTTDSFTPKN